MRSSPFIPLRGNETKCCAIEKNAFLFSRRALFGYISLFSSSTLPPFLSFSLPSFSLYIELLTSCFSNSICCYLHLFLFLYLQVAVTVCPCRPIAHRIVPKRYENWGESGRKHICRTSTHCSSPLSSARYRPKCRTIW